MSRLTFYVLVLGSVASLLALAAVAFSSAEISYIGQVSFAAGAQLTVAHTHGTWLEVPVVAVLLLSVLFPVWTFQHWRRERAARNDPGAREPITYAASDRSYVAGIGWMVTSAALIAVLLQRDDGIGIAEWALCASTAAIGVRKALLARRLGRTLRRRSKGLCTA